MYGCRDDLCGDLLTLNLTIARAVVRSEGKIFEWEFARANIKRLDRLLARSSQINHVSAQLLKKKEREKEYKTATGKGRKQTTNYVKTL